MQSSFARRRALKEQHAAQSETLADIFQDKISEIPIDPNFREFINSAAVCQRPAEQMCYQYCPQASSRPSWSWNQLPSSLDPASELCTLTKKVRALRKQQQLESLLSYVLLSIDRLQQHSKSSQLRVADFCAGSGHVGILLTYLRPHIDVVCVDYNPNNCNMGNARIQQLSTSRPLRNVRFENWSLEECENTLSFQLAVSLHSCGLLTDKILDLCVQQRASFVLCPCCYGQLSEEGRELAAYLQRFGMSGFRLPQSTWARNLLLNERRVEELLDSFAENQQALVGQVSNSGTSPSGVFSLKKHTCQIYNRHQRHFVGGVSSEIDIMGDRASSLVEKERSQSLEYGAKICCVVVSGPPLQEDCQFGSQDKEYQQSGGEKERLSPAASGLGERPQKCDARTATSLTATNFGRQGHIDECAVAEQCTFSSTLSSDSSACVSGALYDSKFHPIDTDLVRKSSSSPDRLFEGKPKSVGFTSKVHYVGSSCYTLPLDVTAQPVVQQNCSSSCCEKKNSALMFSKLVQCSDTDVAGGTLSEKGTWTFAEHNMFRRVKKCMQVVDLDRLQRFKENLAESTAANCWQSQIGAQCTCASTPPTPDGSNACCFDREHFRRGPEIVPVELSMTHRSVGEASIHYECQLASLQPPTVAPKTMF